MNNPLEITIDEIKKLNAVQLTALLKRLLILEAQRLGIAKHAVDVSLNINIPDGGEDARISWSGGPEPDSTSWIPKALTIFQVKATDMGPKDCANEVANSRNDNLKERVRETVENHGAYVLFYNRSCTGDGVTKRKEAIGERFREHCPEGAPHTTIDVYYAEKILDWANEHTAAMAFVKRCCDSTLPVTIQTWDEWNSENLSDFDFQIDNKRSTLINSVKEIAAQKKGIGRILGLYGIGKTRLLIEAFRPPRQNGDWGQAALNAGCVYIPAGINGHVDTLLESIRRLKFIGFEGTLIIDDCPIDIHEKIENISADPSSKFSVITVDNDIASESLSRKCIMLELGPLEDTSMRAMLQASPMPEESIDRAVSIANGHPKMATLLLKASEHGTPLWKLGNRSLFRRIVFPDTHPDEDTWSVAMSISIADHVGFKNDVEYEFRELINKACSVEYEKAFKIVKKLIKTGIVMQRGDYIRLVPLPLSSHLSAEWWEYCTDQKAQEILVDASLPAPLMAAIIEQFERLAGHPQINELIERLYQGEESPFGDRGLLISVRGSRLANSLAEVSPKVIMEALNSALRNLTPEEAETIREGRRNLVRCLQKLVWSESTFEDASWLMLLLASGENEQWANNATNQFEQLFHILLSGTEIRPLDRLSVIRRALNTESVKIRHVAVNALCAAFNSMNFMNLGENRPSGILRREDWVPRSHDQVIEYWEAVTDLLIEVAQNQSDLSPIIWEKVASHARRLIRHRAINIVERFVDFAFESGFADWPEMLEKLKLERSIDSKQRGTSTDTKLDELIERLSPVSSEQKLKHFVSIPSWDEVREDDSGEIVLVAEERAVELAREFAQKPDNVLRSLSILVDGEQRQGHLFGQTFGEEIDDPVRFLEQAIDIANQLSVVEFNAAFLMGVAASISDERVGDLSERLHSMLHGDDQNRRLALELIRAMTAKDADVLEISRLIRDEVIAPNEIRYFSHGRSLRKVSESALRDLAESLLHAPQPGPVVGLDILFFYSYGSTFPSELIPTLQQYLQSMDLLGQLNANGGSPLHYFDRLIERTIDQGVLSEKTIEQMMLNLLSIASSPTFSSSKFVQKASRLLLSKNPDESWSHIKTYLSALDPGEGFFVVRSLTGLFNDGVDFPKLLGTDRLMEWCNEDPKAPLWVAQLTAPLNDSTSTEEVDYPSWTRISVFLLNDFGSNSEIRGEMVSSMLSGSWWGSQVPRLRRFQEAFRELRQHPNPNVSNWAIQMEDNLSKEIKIQERKDEQREFGIDS